MRFAAVDFNSRNSFWTKFLFSEMCESTLYRFFLYFGSCWMILFHERELLPIFVFSSMIYNVPDWFENSFQDVCRLGFLGFKLTIYILPSRPCLYRHLNPKSCLTLPMSLYTWSTNWSSRHYCFQRRILSSPINKFGPSASFVFLCEEFFQLLVPFYIYRV